MKPRYRDLFGNEFDIMRQDMERLLEYFACSKPPMSRFSPSMWQPAVDICESNSELIIIVELSGIKERDVEISFRNNSLIIRGERKRILSQGARYSQMEIPGGPFSREIPLPFAVKAADARAYFDNGILRIIFPKKSEVSLKFDVKTEQA